jgi:hypothetical protein
MRSGPSWPAPDRRADRPATLAAGIRSLAKLGGGGGLPEGRRPDVHRVEALAC